ncbi:hypothetical protein ACF1GW_39035 [Streptomyces achromogenes]|uniref:hypothetical protein n=1 Tax=Streptomyces achromogenes TaxID=67255 RepID=UPI0036FB9681
MPSSTVSSQTTTHTVELSVTDAPALKVEYVYYTVTGLRITYENDTLTALIVIGTAEDTGEPEELPTRLSAYEMVQPWIRDEVEKNRPSRQQSAYRAKVLHEAAAIAGEPIPEGAPTAEWEDLIAAIDAIREEAREAELHAVPSPAMDAREYLDLYGVALRPRL